MRLPLSIISGAPHLRRRAPSSLLPHLEKLEDRTLLAANLQLLSIEAPSNGVVGNGQTIDLTWVVENTGDEPITDTFWFDSVFLSDDELLDATDELMTFVVVGPTSLGPGEQYEFSETIPLGNVAAGDRFLLVAVDDGDLVGEDEEADNVLASPISLITPDVELVVSEFAPSASVIPGQPFFASWTIANLGTETASASFTNRITLSEDDFLDLGDRVIFEEIQPTSIAGGASFASQWFVTMPVDVTVGSYFLFFETDVLNDQSETNDFNNGVAAPIEVVSAGPDLSIVSPDVPADWQAGSTVNFSFSISNEGSLPAENALSVAYYLSDDDQFDLDVDELLATRDYSNLLPLGPATSVLVEEEIVVSTGRLGNQHLLIVVDSAYDQAEEDESNNVSASAIVIGGPNLSFTEAFASESADPGESIDVSWTIANTGSAPTGAGGWRDAIYLSADSVWDAGDLLLGELDYTDDGLEADDDYSAATLVTIPGDVSGSYFLIVVTDRDDALAELDETDNTIAVGIEITPPSLADLVVTDFDAPTTVSVNQLVDFSWTVTNVGAAPLAGSWQDRLFLSPDATLSEFDTILQIEFIDRPAGLGLNESYTVNRSIAIPNVPAGDYFFFVRTLAVGPQDGDPSNNVISLGPVSIRKPDLVVTEFDAPATAIGGDSISVTYTVLNDSDVPMGASQIADRIVLSDDAIIDGSDQFLSLIIIPSDTLPLGPQESYTRTVNVVLPGGSHGSKFLILRTDALVNQGETNDDNNTVALPIEILAPDLSVQIDSSPVLAALGTTIEVTYTVQNDGSVPALSNWVDSIYLTSDVNQLGVLLGTFSTASFSPLLAGGSYQVTRSVLIPNSATAGPQFLRVVTNSGNNSPQPETDFSNNFDLAPIEIFLDDVNLVIDAFDAPAFVTVGESFGVSWVVRNEGAGFALSDWIDRVYLSDDPNLDASDTILLTRENSAISPLGPNGNYAVSSDIVLSNGTLGQKYLILATDSGGTQPETNEADNFAVLPIVVSGVDLVVESIVVPASATFGVPFEVTYTVRNAGNVPTFAVNWSDRVSLSNEDASQAIILSEFLITLDQPLQPGETYTRTFTVNAPPVAAAGNYRVGVGIDISNTQGELDDGNNFLLSDLLTVSLPPVPDLVITSVVAPVEGFSGQQFSVTWTVTNEGDATAVGPWDDRVRIQGQQASVDFGLFHFAGDLAPGESVTRTEVFEFPLIDGNYVITIETDHLNAVLEGPNESNSVSTASIPITSPPLPDLVITSIVTPPDGVVSGSTVPISFTVTNVGPVATQTPVWTDYVLLSTDPTLFDPDPSIDDTRFFSQPLAPIFFANPTYLEPGQSYTQTIEATIPLDAAGPWYVYVFPNGLGGFFPVPSSLRESNRSNNVAISDSFIVNLAPPPDLVVSQVLAPPTVFSGQPVDVSWTVTNSGPGLTGSNSWFDRVYLSTDMVLDDADILLRTGAGADSFAHLGRLSSGETYGSFQQFILPQGISGEYFILVATDVFGEVFEAGVDSNNSAARPALVILTPPPDLVVDAVSVSAPATASRTVDVTYTVTNRGNTATPVTNSIDTIYLSLDDELDASDTVLGDVWGFAGSLAVDQSYTKTRTVTLPDGIEGEFFVLVSANTNETVFELDRLNNILTSDPVPVENRPANLVVTDISADATAIAGQLATVSWTVTNIGVGDTAVSRWVDKVYLSTDGTTAGGRLLGSFLHDGLLDAGESYTRTAGVTIPFDVDGDVHLYVVTDDVVTLAESTVFLPPTGPGGNVFESANEGDNASALANLSVSRITPDLVVTDLSGPSVAETGESILVTWTVQNVGGPTNADTWIDDLYLSSDSNLSADDIRLGSLFHSGILVEGASYVGSLEVNIPQSLAAGEYSILVQTDRAQATGPFDVLVNRVSEGGSEANNIAASPVQVVQSPVADLVASAVQVPATTIAGRSLSVSWTVTNSGPVAANGTWSDAVYLSLDQVLDTRTDRFLGYVTHHGGLAPGEQYDVSGSFEIPGGLVGAYYVFVRTDATDLVFERLAEANNDAYQLQSIQLILGEPIDFVVGAIQVPVTAAPGTLATIGYTVDNNIDLPVPGGWTDAIYLSSDEVWDPSDTLFARVRRTEDLAAGASYSETITATLPVLAPGTYRVIVRTDVLNNVVETSDANNIGVSLDVATVDATPLELGTPRTDLLPDGGFLLYRVDVAAGQTLRFSWDSTNDAASTELFVRFNAPPSRAVFDARSNEPFAADQAVVVPRSEAGTYFVLVRSSQGSAVGDILAESVPFSVSSATPSAVGNAGAVTLDIAGGLFTRGTTFELSGPNGTIVPATMTIVADASRAYATFDLTGVEAGSFDLVARATNGAIAVAEDAVEVVPSLVGGVLTTGITVPSVTLTDSLGNFFITYTNTGDNDLAAPLLTVRSSTGNLFRQGSFDGVTGVVAVLYGAVPEGPAGILRPGQSITIPFVFQATSELNALYSFELTYFDEEDDTPIDWARLEFFTDPAVLAAEDYPAIFAQLQASIGSTMGDYVRMLSRNAQLAPTLDFARDEPNLFAIELEKAIAAVRTSLAGRIVSDDLDIVLSDRQVLATDLLSGDVFVTRTYRDGSFLFSSIPSGIYEFEFEGAIVVPGELATVEEGEHVTDFEVMVERGLRIGGQVLVGVTPVAGAAVTAISEEGGVVIGETDASGRFLLGGLLPGTYTISIEAEGFAAFEQTGIVVSSTDVATTAVLSVESVINGSVVLPPGGPSDTEMLISATGSNGQSFVSTTTSTAFRLDGLPADVYSLRIVRAGYVPVELVGIDVAVGQTASLVGTPLVQAAIIRGEITAIEPGLSTAFLPVAAFQGDDLAGVVLADAAGAFVFDELAPGTYEVRIANPALFSNTVSVTSVTGTETVANIAVDSGATIFGVVRLASSEDAVPGILVSLLRADGTLLQTVTDATGFYQFSQLVLGDYVAFLGSGGESSFQAVSISETNGELYEADLTLENLAEVAGRVTSADGTPIANAFVTVVKDNATLAYSLTDDQGRYRLIFQQAGIFDLRAFGENATFTPVSSVNIEAGTTLLMDFVAGQSTLAIEATFEGEPAAGAVVRLTTASGIDFFAVTDSTGAATLQNLVAGTYTVNVRNTAGGEATTTIVLGAAQSESIPVDLVVTSSLAGTVRGPGNVLIANATIIVYAAGTDEVIGQTTTDANGEYLLQYLTPGAYDVVAFADGLGYQLQTGVNVSGSTALPFALATSTHQVTVRIQDASGQGVPFARVTIRDAVGRIVDSVVVDDQGLAILTSAIGPDLTISAFAYGYAPSSELPLDLSTPGATDIGVISLASVAFAANVLAEPELAGFAFDFGGASFASFQAASATATPWAERIRGVLNERLLKWFEQDKKLRFPPPTCPQCRTLWEEAKEAVQKFRDAYFKASELGKDAIEKAKKFAETAVAISEQVSQLVGEFDTISRKLRGMLISTKADQRVVALDKARIELFTILPNFTELFLVDSLGQADAKFAPLIETTNRVRSTINSLVTPIDLDFGDYQDPESALAFELLQILVEIQDRASEYLSSASTVASAEQDFDSFSEKATELGHDAFDAVIRYLKCNSAHQDCDDKPPPGGNPGGSGAGNNGRREDPNDIVGPAGYGDPRFVASTQSLGYRINFENLAAATLPVQSLTITTQLDDDLDYRSIRFGSFGFRGLTFEVATNQPFLNQRLDLTDSLGFFVDVIATVDVTTGLATWTLSAIDPATGEEPLDERVGFLPPNDAESLGEGFVTYFVRAATGVQTGDAIDAQATIIFDTEPPLDTPVWSNTIDAGLPTSQVNTLPSETTTPAFLISWVAEDLPGGSGIARTTIYVSQDGGAYRTLLVADDQTREFLFEGKVGSTYAFLSVAEDNAGNRESAPGLPDAQITIAAPAATLDIAAPTETILGQEVSFAFIVGNFAEIPGYGYIVQVDWNDDGTFDRFLVGPSGSTLSHSFAVTGLQTVRAILLDVDGSIAAEASFTIDVASFGLTPDPVNPGVVDLVWGGTAENDHYRFEELDATTVRVLTLDSIGGVLDSVDFTGVSGVVRVNTLSGDDFIDGSGLFTKALVADGGAGDDTILGGAADDFLDGDGAEGRGNDLIDGGAGNDTIFGDGPKGFDPGDTTGRDTIRGGDGNDVIYGDGAEGSNDDSIEGGSGDDVIYADGAEGIFEQGTYGQDTVSGGEGDDLIVGDGAEGAADRLAGDAGNDVIVGGLGGDELDGGSGSDLVFAGTLLGFDASSNLLVRAEWTSVRPLQTRIDNLRGTGSGDRANGDVFLTPSNVRLDDQAIDTVLGGADEDWLLADAEEDLVVDFDPIDDVLAF